MIRALAPEERDQLGANLVQLFTETDTLLGDWIGLDGVSLVLLPGELFTELELVGVPEKLPARPRRAGHRKKEGLLWMEAELLNRWGSCPGGEYGFVDDPALAVRLLDHWSAHQLWAAVDLETSVGIREALDPLTGQLRPDYILGSDPFTSRILLCSVSVEAGVAIVFDMRVLEKSPAFQAAFRRFLETARLICHNASFEQGFFQAQYGVLANIVFDTMLVHQLLTAGLPAGSDLESVLAKYEGLTLEKRWQKFFIQIHPDSPLPNEAIAYSAGDVCRLLSAAAQIDAEFFATSQYHLWTQVERPFMRWIAEATHTGIAIDRELLERLLVTAQQERDEQLALFQAVAPGVLIGSWQQLLAWFNSRSLSLKDTTDTTMQALIRTVPAGSAVGQAAAALLGYRAAAKIASTYIEPYLTRLVNPATDRIHPHWKQASTVTGRMACVAAGTKIEVLRDVAAHPEGIPIEAVQPGDRVYCFNEARELALGEVTAATKTGHRAVVRVHWVMEGNHQRTGHVDVTPDHHLRLTNGAWVAAEKLEPGDRLLSLSRGLGEGYARLWATGHPEISCEHRFVYQQLYGELPEHVHHRNENRLDQRPENLQGMTNTEHGRLHGQETSPALRQFRAEKLRHQWATTPEVFRPVEAPRGRWRRITPAWLEQILWENQGCTTVFRDRYGLDYATTLAYMAKYGIDPKAIARQFNARGEWITPEQIATWREISETDGKQAGRAAAGLGWARWREVQEEEGYIPYNHRVVRIEVLPGTVDVYDLTVAEHHSFIAGGVLVHNCADPNFQNIPSNGPYTVIRNGLVAPAGMLLGWADYSQFEVRALADAAREPKMLSVFHEGYQINQELTARLTEYQLDYTLEEVTELPQKKAADWQVLVERFPSLGPLVQRAYECDFHRRTAATLFHKPVNEITKQERANSKAVTFGLPYGAGPKGISETAKISLDEAKRLVREYERTFPAVKQFLDRCKQEGRQGETRTAFGRVRRYPLPSQAKLEGDLERLKQEEGAAQKWQALVAQWESDDPRTLAGAMVKSLLRKIEREATNQPIQGANADATKLATVLAGPRLKELDENCVILMWVHDEIVLQAPAPLIGAATQILREAMVAAAEQFITHCPIETSISIGRYWSK